MIGEGEDPAPNQVTIFGTPDECSTSDRSSYFYNTAQHKDSVLKHLKWINNKKQ